MRNDRLNRLGIGVVTYKRPRALARTISAIQRYTTTPYCLIVADDGSNDETIDLLKGLNVPYVTGDNRGIAWNKNRALFYLNTYSRCDTIIIIEDDTFPNASGWESEWVRACNQWGHVNIAAPWRSSYWKSGSGTAEDPLRSEFLSGQVSAFSSEALGVVGYLDTRFGTYGYEHVEHTTRMINAGYGGELDPRLFFLLKGSIEITSEPSHGTEERTAENAAVAKAISNESLSFGAPWRTVLERDILLKEMKIAIDLTLSKGS